ncbi:MAG: AI-2E family transporter [Pseudomonadota bacterium]
MNSIRVWFQEHLSNPQVFALAVLLVVFFGIVTVMGEMLMPVLASIVIAYLLEGLVVRLCMFGIPRLPAVLFVFFSFLVFMSFVGLGLLPLISRQATQLAGQIPTAIEQFQSQMMLLAERYPAIFSEQQVQELIDLVRLEITNMGREIVTMSVSSVVGLITLSVYAILVPMLVFFFMKDKSRILQWVLGYLPRDLSLATVVWRDLDRQIGNYIRGKFLEILILWWATYITFAILGLNYSLLLSLLVGISVLIPYIGAVVVTIPVALVAYMQWGFTSDLGILMGAYLVVQALDGTAVVPVLFSEVVSLHPVAIITAVLVFGGLWGFWGVFFAIPLATLVQAVLTAWPTGDRLEAEVNEPAV